MDHALVIVAMVSENEWHRVSFLLVEVLLSTIHVSQTTSFVDGIVAVVLRTVGSKHLVAWF